MNLSRTLLPIAVLCTATLLGAAAIQGAGQDKPTAEPAGMPMVKPTKEHQAMQKLVGNWDATVTMMVPGMPPATSRGTAVYKSVGEMWVVEDFTGDMMGAPFSGHGVHGFDPNKKKCVGTWVDSMTAEMMVLEGTYDEATKTQTMIGEARDMTGKMVKHRMVTEMKDADTLVFHMHVPGPDGKEAEMMKIEYKRKK